MNQSTILLVDADEDSLSVYSALLRHHGYYVLVARNPDEGVRVARTALPDLILSDLQERTETGWLPIEAFRADPLTGHIPVVALTARVMEEDRASAVASGCTHYLTKPLQPADLVAIVASMLGSDGVMEARSVTT